MKTKIVKLSLSNYQIDKLKLITGKSALSAAIIRFVDSNVLMPRFVDRTIRDGVNVRLPIETIDKLLNGHKSASAGLMARMNVHKKAIGHRSGYKLSLSESQRDALELLGGGSVEEGLKVLIGE